MLRRDRPPIHLRNTVQNKIIQKSVNIPAIGVQLRYFTSKKFSKARIQKYVGHLKEAKRTIRRHSSFWRGLYGHYWVIGIEGSEKMIEELMAITQNKILFFQRSLRAMSLMIRTF